MINDRELKRLNSILIGAIRRLEQHEGHVSELDILRGMKMLAQALIDSRTVSEAIARLEILTEDD